MSMFKKYVLFLSLATLCTSSGFLWADPPPQNTPTTSKSPDFILNIPDNAGKISEIKNSQPFINSKAILSLHADGIGQNEFGFYGVKVFVKQKDSGDEQRIIFDSSFQKSIKVFDKSNLPTASDLFGNWYVTGDQVGKNKTFDDNDSVPIIFYFPNDHQNDLIFRLDLGNLQLANTTDRYSVQEGDQIIMRFYEFFPLNSNIDRDQPKPDVKKYQKESEYLSALYKNGYFSIVPQPGQVITLKAIDYGAKLTANPTFLFATKFSDDSDAASKNLNPTAKAPGINTLLIYEYLDGGNDFGNWCLNNVAPMPSIGAISSSDGTYQFTPGISMPTPVLNWLWPEEVNKLLRENFRIFVGMENFKDPVYGFTITLPGLDLLKPSAPGGTTDDKNTGEAPK